MEIIDAIKTDRLDYVFEFIYKNITFYFYVFSDTKKIWIDINGLPKSAFLCAAYDGAHCFQKTLYGKPVKFLEIDWVINEWGGDPELIELIKKRKEVILGKIVIEKLKED